MLDFHRGPKPPNYLSRREQWRVMILVLALGLVVILMFEARKPEHYQWLVPRGSGVATSTRPQDGSADDRQVDTRLLAEVREGEIPGTFLSPAPGTPDGPGPPRFFPGVEPSYLDSIRDNRPVGPSEWQAWLHLFDVLRKHDEATLEAAATGRVGFVQLFEQSAEYRGELVTIRGVIRRAHPAKTPRNDYGLTDYYQLWLQPDDHPTDPMAVWCLHVPKGFPTGMQIAEDVEVTGFYFKLWAYKAADGAARRAPLLLAREIHWRRRPKVAQTPPDSPLTPVMIIVAAAALAVFAAGYVHYRTRSSGTARDEALVKHDTAPDIGAALQQLAESKNPPENPA